MTISFFKKAPIILASLVPFFDAVATNTPTDDLFDMSIEQLLNMETSVAGFSSESIVSAPSVVSVFTAMDIQRLGVSNVYDLMNFVPGFQSVTGEFLAGHQKLQSRGVYLDSGYVLVMLDGVRVNEMSFGKAGVYTPYLDLDLAEKVEIIRGPGSAVYGSNAFLGVINIISKKQNSIKVEFGQNDHKKLVTGFSQPLSVGELSFNAALVKGDGQSHKLKLANDIGPQTVSAPYEHQQFSIQWAKDLAKVSYQTDNHELNNFVNLEGYHPDNYYKSQNHYFSAHYEKNWNAKTSYAIDAQYADHEVESAGYIFSGDISPFSNDFITGPYWATNRFTVNASLSHVWSDKINSDFGVQWQSEKQHKAGVVTTHVTPDFESTIPLDQYYLGELTVLKDLGEFEAIKQTIESVAFYGQLKWQISPVDTLHVGARFEDYKTAGSAFSPRVTYVRKLDDNSQIKAIYSEAFRAPVTNELFSNDSVTLGNPSLKPELVRTTELQYFYQEAKCSLEITGFYTSLSELIASEPIDDGGRTTFVNKGNKDLYGLEALFNYEMTPSWRLRATGTHFLSDTVEGSYDSFYSVGVYFQNGKWKASVNGLLRPSLAVDEGIRLDQKQNVFKESAQQILNVSASYQLGKHLNLQINIDNLTDASYLAYEPRQNRNQYSVPQKGAHTRVSVKYDF